MFLYYMTEYKVLPIEIFSKYQVFNNYEISKLGVVRHIETKEISEQKVNSDGYYRVILYNGISKSSYQVNHLMAQTYLTNPNKLPLYHKDGDHLNHILDNLQYGKPKGIKLKVNPNPYIYWIKERSKWRANVPGSGYHIGLYETLEEAIKAQSDYVEKNK